MQLYDEPRVYETDRAQGDVLVGTDNAAPLIDAAAKGDAGALSAMLKQKLWTDYALERPHRIYSTFSERKALARPIPNFETMLDLAIMSRDVPTAQFLFNWGTRHGFPLSDTINRETVAASLSSIDMYAALIDIDSRAATMHMYHGADVMSNAVQSNQLDMLELMFRNGATIAISNDTRDLRPRYDPGLLNDAAQNASPPVIDLLIKKGASIPGSGALHGAIAYGKVDNAEALLRHGADVNERVLRRLVRYEPRPDDGPTWTPLHVAMAYQQYDLAAWLRGHGADDNAKNEEGQTPSDVDGTAKRKL